MAKKIWYLFYWIGPNFDRLPCIFHCITFLLHNSITFITSHNHHDTHKKHNLTKNAVVKFFKKESLWSLLVLDWYTVVQISFAVATFYIQLQKWPFLKELGNHQLKVWSKTILVHDKYGLENQGLEVYNFWIARGKWEWMNLCCH